MLIFTGIAGIVLPTFRPYRWAYFYPIAVFFLVFEVRQTHGMTACAAVLAERTPWIYYSRNISTTTTHL
jgi:hypothetical protein